MQNLVAQVPVHIIVHPDPGLLGAAVAAARRQDSPTPH
jgi:glucokinase